MQATARRTNGTPQDLHIGPTDAGRRLTWEEFRLAHLRPGFRYEIIDGRLVVAATPNPRHSTISQMTYGALFEYMRSHRDVFNHLSSSSTVFIPGRQELTAPQPDVAAYRDFDYERLNAENYSWREVDPMLVVEIISPDSPDKDLFRNVELYELVPSIREYWILDPRDGPSLTTMKVYRRRGGAWQKPIDIGPGELYTTKLLPGFRLRLDPLA